VNHNQESRREIAAEAEGLLQEEAQQFSWKWWERA